MTTDLEVEYLKLSQDKRLRKVKNIKGGSRIATREIAMFELSVIKGIKNSRAENIHRREGE